MKGQTRKRGDRKKKKARKEKKRKRKKNRKVSKENWHESILGDDRKMSSAKAIHKDKQKGRIDEWRRLKTNL